MRSMFATIGCLMLIVAASPSHAETPTQPCPVWDERDFIVYYPSGTSEPFPESAPVANAFAEYMLKLVAEKYPCWGPPPERVIVTGHTDTFGDAEANMALSRARAEAMAAKLKALGVSVPIEVRWRGESELAVDTGDNVHEVLNNRVDLEYR